jgi:hypothetical protein
MAEKKDTAKPAAAPPTEGAEGEKAQSHKKINKMTLGEIDAKLNEVRVSQGGLKSRYAKQLLQRKKTLGA